MRERCHFYQPEVNSTAQLHTNECFKLTYGFCLCVCLMVFNATFNNISVISWRSVLLVEETGGPGENHWPAASHWQTLSHNVVHLTLIEPTTSVVMATDCIGGCKSNYHMIMATTAPLTNGIGYVTTKDLIIKEVDGVY